MMMKTRITDIESKIAELLIEEMRSGGEMDRVYTEENEDGIFIEVEGELFTVDVTKIF